MKLKHILLNESISPWSGEGNNAAEQILQSMNGVTSERVGNINSYTINNIKNLTGNYKNLTFYQHNKYTAWLSSIGQGDSSKWICDPKTKLISLYDDAAGNKFAGYLFRNASGDPEFSRTDPYAPKPKTAAPSGDAWEKIKYYMQNPALFINTMVAPPQKDSVDALLGILDWTGFIEAYGIGAISDLLAAIIHFKRGNLFNASLSAIAILPMASYVTKSFKIATANATSRKLIEKMGTLSNVKEIESGKELYQHLLQTGVVDSKTLDKLSDGYRSVAKYILGLSSKGNINTYDKAIESTADFLNKCADITNDVAQKAAKVNKLTPSIPLAGLKNTWKTLATSNNKVVEFLKIIAKSPLLVRHIGSLPNYITKLPEPQLKVMQNTLKKSFLNSIKGSPDKIQSILQVTKPGDLDKLITKFKNSPVLENMNKRVAELRAKLVKDPDNETLKLAINKLEGQYNSLSVAVGNIIRKSYTAAVPDKVLTIKDPKTLYPLIQKGTPESFNKAAFATEFIAKAKEYPVLDDMFLDWLSSTNNLFYLEWFNDIFKQIKTVGFTPWAKGAGIWDSVKSVATASVSSMTNLKKWLDIIASEVANRMDDETAEEWNLKKSPHVVTQLLQDFYNAYLQAKILKMIKGDSTEPNAFDFIQQSVAGKGLGYDEDITGKMQTSADSTAAANKKP